MSQPVALTGFRIRSVRPVPIQSGPASGGPALPEAAWCDVGLPPANPTKPRLLDQVREVIRTRHYRYRTEEAYVGWIKRFILFHGKRHPAEMGAAEVSQFLSSLAIDGHVSAATQNQALAALLFLYREVLARDFGWLNDVVRAKRTLRLPVVLTWGGVTVERVSESTREGHRLRPQ